MARLTTHVLDTATGRPAKGVRVELHGDALLAEAVTNADGRTDAPMADLPPGTYELRFHAGDYLRATGQPDGFLDVIPIRFRVSDDRHHHVPLLLSPFAFSTYRGS